MAGSERMGWRTMVAVDESKERMYALQWAVDNLLDQKEHETIILMHAETPAVSKLALAGHAAVSAGHHVLEEPKTSSLTILCHAKRILVSAEIKEMTGETQYAICEAANELKVDLLVVGTHGHGALKRKCERVLQTPLQVPCDGRQETSPLK